MKTSTIVFDAGDARQLDPDDIQRFLDDIEAARSSIAETVPSDQVITIDIRARIRFNGVLRQLRADITTG